MRILLGGRLPYSTRFLRRLSSSSQRIIHLPPPSVGGEGSFRIGDAVLKYWQVAPQVLDAHSTFVPEHLRGGGVANILAKAIFSHAHEHEQTIIPSCCYLSSRFIPDNSAQHASIALQSFSMPAPGLQIEVTWTGVATVRLTDDRRRNPLTNGILGALGDWLRNLEGKWPDFHDVRATGTAVIAPSSSVRCVVLEAEGPVFSAGHDFKDFDGADQAAVRQVLTACAEVNILLSRIPQVSVAAVGGAALAGGAQLASSCDIVLAHADRAKFTLTGVHAGGYCHTPLVAYAGRLPLRKALELGALGDTIDAYEAERIGLANRVIQDVDWRNTIQTVAERLADSFGKNSADGKRTLYRQAMTADVADRYAIATPVMEAMFESAPWKRHMDRFLRKKK